MAIQVTKKRLETEALSNNSSQKSDLIQDKKKKIEEAAYYFAEKRGFQPGHELEDWLAAERYVSTLVKRSSK